MVTFQMLSEANTDSWMQASIDAEALAVELEDAASHIYERGTAPVQRNWEGELGDKVGSALKAQADAYLSSSAVARTNAGLIATLASSIATLRDSLHDYCYIAEGSGLRVLSNGKLMPISVDPSAGEHSQIRKLQNLIDEAVQSATAIDEEARNQFAALVESVGHSVTDVKNKFSPSASNTEVAILRESLPIGCSPAEVALWWKGLSNSERSDLERGVPVELYDLIGIPADVKDRLVGSSGYSAVDSVRFALDRWNTDVVPDDLGNKCASFVSESLAAGGLPFKGWNTLDRDSWAQAPWNDHRGALLSHSEAWRVSDSQMKFFLENGGTRISNPTSARPGDVIYWVQEGDKGANPNGRAHHAAIVTAVTPSGDILYTQQTPAKENVSLNTRQPSNDADEGNQDIVVVRPRLTW